MARFTFPEPNEHVRAAAHARQARLTKPAASLGRLEDVAVQLAATQGVERPAVRPAAALLFAADHPVTAHGVSAYPQTVTRAMIANLAKGGAAASVLAEQVQLPLHIVDVGVRDGASIPPPAATSDRTLVRAPVADACEGDPCIEDAMTRETYAGALAAGHRAVDRLPPHTRVLILGELGIGNTTCAAAVSAACLGLDPEQVVGTGSGLDAQGRARKADVVRRCIERIREREQDDVLASVGGRELVALAGATARAVEHGITVVVDGYVCAAGLLPLALGSPAIRPWLVHAHLSREPGHRHVLSALGASALLHLDLALGEASGGLTAFPLLELACALHARMATFDEAGVPETPS